MTAKKACSTPGCPALVKRTARGGRCHQCNRKHEQRRGAANTRGYDYAHQQLRAHYQQRMDDGEQITCWRCGEQINPHDWALGHDDHDRTRYRGPECPPCNYATAGRRPPRGVPPYGMNT